MVSGKTSMDVASQLGNDMRALLEEKTFCDMKIVLSDTEVQAHKCILFARSEYFKALLTGFEEGKMGRIAMNDSDTTEENVTLMLDFLYTNVLSDETDANKAIGLLPLANYLQLTRLLLLCETIIETSLDIESVVFVWQLAR